MIILYKEFKQVSLYMQSARSPPYEAIVAASTQDIHISLIRQTKYRLVIKKKYTISYTEPLRYIILAVF